MSAKVFNSDLPPKINFPKEYQDMEGMPDITANEKILKKVAKEKKLAMSYLHLSVDLDKAT